MNEKGEKYFKFEVDNKWGFISENGNIVIHPVYDDVGDFSEGLARACLDDSHVLIDKGGNIVDELDCWEIDDDDW